VAKTLALASQAGVTVVPYGSGTGLMGGARTVRPGIVLDTNALNAIEVHAADRFAWAGSGAVLADVDRALQPHGLILAHDPWTFPVATVGGTLSTNSLGYKGGRYGGMADQALALEVALADGTLLRTRAVRRHSAGPNLARLFIGAEGTLGVITAAALEARAAPEKTELHAYNFDTFEQGFAAIDSIISLGLRPSLLDYGEEHASRWPDLIEREDEEALLYLGFEGWAGEVEASMSRAEGIVRENGGRELPQSKAQGFWDQRHVVAERFARNRRDRDRGNWRSPDVAWDYIHVSLPPSRVLDFRRLCHEASDRGDCGLLECGLWTAPDFFSAVFALPAADGGYERLRSTIDGLLRQVQDFGGSMEYVHGAGLRYSHLMAREHGAGLDVLRRIKAALDPQGILNPDKLGL
jgi:FAD/FMN-containing dehydrogenase